MKAILALEDGRHFIGESFGATGEQSGEICFNTSMTGYQEILTDWWKVNGLDHYSEEGDDLGYEGYTNKLNFLKA